MRFRSLIGAFSFFVMASFVSALFYIQTESFGRVLSRIITDLGHKKADAKISLSRVDINYFPPGIEFEEVKFAKKISEQKSISFELGKVGLYIGLIEFDEMKLSLGEMRVSDSVVEYYAPQDKEELKEIDEKVINNIFDAAESLPLRIDTLLLQNTKIIYNHELLDAKRLKLTKKGRSFLLRFHIANLKPLAEDPISIDELWGDIQLGRKNLSIQRLKIQHDVHTLLVKAKVKDYRLLRNADINLSGESVVFLGNLKDDLILPDFVNLKKGYTHLSFNGSFKNQVANANADISISDLDSDVLKADQIIGSIGLEKNHLILKKLNITYGKEFLKIKSPREIYNIEKKILLPGPIDINLENFSLSNALGFMPELKILKGRVTGGISLAVKQKDIKIHVTDLSRINDLKLVVGNDKPFTILSIQQANLTNTIFEVEDKTFKMDSLIALKNSKLHVLGTVNSKAINFDVKESKVDFEDFGNISQLDIKGRGILDISVFGSPDDTILNFKGRTSGFEVLGYKLGSADKDISISLKDSTVLVTKLESIYRTTPISGTGTINYKNLDIALGINSTKASLHDLKEILHPIFKQLDFLPTDLDMIAKIDANIFGKTKLDKLKLKSEVVFNDLSVLGESFSTGEMTIGLNNQNLIIKDFLANKGRGQFRGDFLFNLADHQFNIDYEWDEFKLSSFRFAKKTQLNFDGTLSGSLKGKGKQKDYKINLEAKIDETKSQDYKFPDSLISIQLTPQVLSGDIDIFGKFLKSEFDIGLDQNLKSKINVVINSPHIKPVATAILGEHLETEEFDGELKLNLSTSFRKNFENMNLVANLEKFKFKHESFNVDFSSKTPQFLIEDNHVKRWNLYIEQPDIFIKTKGNGVFGETVKLVHEANLNSKIFEILFAPILSAEGFSRNSFTIEGKSSKYEISGNLQANDLNLTVESVPFPLNHLSYNLDFSKNKLTIRELRSSLENGYASFLGDVYLNSKYPDVNLKFQLDKAEFPIMGKSFVNVSGDGIILGSSPPYNVTGEIILNKTQILNELTDFSSKSDALSQVRYLPPDQESQLGKFFNLNLDVKTDNPIRIANSLMDISLRGEVNVTGSPTRPRGDGRLKSVPNSARVFFKNNEYTILNADITFNPKKEITNPDFDLQALTFISTYKVNAKAYGDLERFNFDLTSEPSLTRNSILSLIAFGYSDEIQSSLTQQQQQNLTQVGVGSFVFDRFKISDILNKQFGLQVNLGTVFEQSTTASMLSGRTQEGQTTLGRTRTATRIELKKRLDEALNLSVSSTMGGSIGQRQSMNLNYSLNKKVQLEGVYELKTNADGEEDIIDNSIGGDLKFRWTFK